MAAASGKIRIGSRADHVTIFIDGKAIGTLKAKVEGNPYRLLSPYPGLKSAVSLQAWGRQIYVDSASDPKVDIGKAMSGRDDQLGDEVDADVTPCAAVQQRDGSSTADADVEHVAMDVFPPDPLQQNTLGSIDPTLGGLEASDLTNVGPHPPVGALRTPCGVFRRCR